MRGARWLLVVGALFASVVACDDDTVVPPATSVWRAQWSHPLPHGATIRGLGGWTEFDQWAVGDGGLIARYRGLGLRAVTSPTTNTLRDVVAFSATEVVMVGDAGTIVGPGLVLESSPTTEDLHSLFAFSSSNLLAVGANGTIIENDGGGWSSVTSPTSADLFGVWGLVSGEVIAVGEGGVVIRSVGGGPWALVPSFTSRDLNAVWADKPGDWFAVGDGGEIWQERGSGWTPMSSPRSDDFYDVFGSDSAYVWAVGDADSILFYDQIAWRPVAPSPTGHLDAVWATICPLSFVSNDAGARVHCSNTFFAGAGGIFARYTLFNTFDLLSTAETYADLRGIHGGPNGDVYAVGEAGVVMRHDGAAWSQSPTSIAENLNDVFVVSPLDVFLVGDGGRILRGVDGAWSPMASPTAAELRGVWAESSSFVLAAGDGGTVLRFDGVDWNPETVPFVDYTDVWGFSSGEALAVACGGAIIERAGGAWNAVASPVVTDLYGVWGSDVDHAFAVGSGGVILRRGAGGWETMVSGVTDSLLAVSGTGSAVWAVGRDGVVLRLEGTSWKVLESQPVTALGGVFVRNGEQVFAAGTTGSIIRFRREEL